MAAPGAVPRAFALRPVEDQIRDIETRMTGLLAERPVPYLTLVQLALQRSRLLSLPTMVPNGYIDAQIAGARPARVLARWLALPASGDGRGDRRSSQIIAEAVRLFLHLPHEVERFLESVPFDFRKLHVSAELARGIARSHPQTAARLVIQLEARVGDLEPVVSASALTMLAGAQATLDPGRSRHLYLLAESAARDIARVYERAFELTALAEALSSVDEVAFRRVAGLALQAALAVEGSGVCSGGVHSRLAAAYFESGDLDEARRVLGKLGTRNRTEVLLTLARRAPEARRALIHEAVDLLEDSPSGELADHYRRFLGLMTAAELLEPLDRGEAARLAWIADLSGRRLPVSVLRASIITLLVKINVRAARGLAKEVFPDLSVPWAAKRLAGMAAGLAVANPLLARRCLRLAERASATLWTLPDRAEEMVSLARAATRVDPAWATEIADRLEELLATSHADPARVRVLLAVVPFLFRVNPDHARAVLDQAVAGAEELAGRNSAQDLRERTRLARELLDEDPAQCAQSSGRVLTEVAIPGTGDSLAGAPARSASDLFEEEVARAAGDLLSVDTWESAVARLAVLTVARDPDGWLAVLTAPPAGVTEDDDLPACS